MTSSCLLLMGLFSHGDNAIWEVYVCFCCPSIFLSSLQIHRRLHSPIAQPYGSRYAVPGTICKTAWIQHSLAIPNLHLGHHSLHALTQWETTLRCNVVSNWLGTYNGLASHKGGNLRQSEAISYIPTISPADTISALCNSLRNSALFSDIEPSASKS